MKGTLTKTEKGWVVRWDQEDHRDPESELPLHPDNAKMCNDYSVDWDGKELEFDWCVIVDHDTGKGIQYAKLMTRNKLDLNKIESKIDEALANETPEKLLGWMWKDIEKEDSMNFICQDPDCPHCIEEINQMQDDDLEDDVEKLSIKLWKASDDRTGNPPYIYSLGVEHGYNNAKESLYTEEQVRKAYEYGSNASLGVSKTNLIQSLKK